MRLNKIYSIIFMLIAAATSASAVNAEEPDKRGAVDAYISDPKARGFERKAVGSNGHYLVDGNYFNRDGSVNDWIEDEEGNDLYANLYGAEVADDKFEVWEVYNGYLNPDLKLIPVSAIKKRYCIRFDDFVIIADGDESIPESDPADTEHTRYFDIDGNEIEDVYKYISDHGAKPEDGVYFDKYFTAQQQKFIKSTNVYDQAERQRIFSEYLEPPEIPAPQEMVEFADTVYSPNALTTVRFDGFEFIAVMDLRKNRLCDPTDIENTKYFAPDGSEIKDVYAYIAEHGAEPADGKYYHGMTFNWHLFTPMGPVVGVRDLYADELPSAQKRVKIGNSGRYLVNYDPESGIGSWVEDEDGRDILGLTNNSDDVQYTVIWVTDEDAETYCVQHRTVHPTGGEYTLYDSDLNVIGNGWDDSPYPPVKLRAAETAEETVSAESTSASETVSEPNTAAAVQPGIPGLTGLKVKLIAISACLAVIIYSLIKFIIKR